MSWSVRGEARCGGARCVEECGGWGCGPGRRVRESHASLDRGMLCCVLSKTLLSVCTVCRVGIII